MTISLLRPVRAVPVADRPNVSRINDTMEVRARGCSGSTLRGSGGPSSAEAVTNKSERVEGLVNFSDVIPSKRAMNLEFQSPPGLNMRPHLKVLSTVSAMTVSLLVSVSAGVAAIPAQLEYNRDVRPIISENCFVCHGMDSGSRKAKLRLDSFAEATAKREGGEPAIIPGKPDDSEAIRRIFDEGDDLMPPEKSHKVLTAPQKELLKRWVAEGAKYEPHWSFIAPVKTPLPKVQNTKWIRNSIDNFILERLEREKLQPAPEADRRMLARRLSYDLTGLPPAPAEVEAFVADQSPDAYEKLVDRWLASPHWGEHRGRYWLDAARYGDTHGIHFDNYREMWTYRDWVINAFNANMPFDRFTIENLAGDLLPDATRDQKIGSGFNRCNITTSEGGAIDEEYQVLYTRDRTEAASLVWLGMTTGCAVCHDHKYDPFSQKEFYQLAAFFNNTTQKAMDGNVKDTPPVIMIPKPEDETRWAAVVPELTAVDKQLDARKKEARLAFNSWRQSSESTNSVEQMPEAGLVFRAALDEGEGSEVLAQVAGERRKFDGSTNTMWKEGVIAAKAWFVPKAGTLEFPGAGDFERDQKFSAAAWVKPGKDKNGSVFARMTESQEHRGWDLFLEGKKVAVHLVNSWPANAIKVIAKKELPNNKWSHVCVSYDGSSKAAGVSLYVNGEEQELELADDALTSSIRTDVPFTLGQRHRGDRLDEAGLQDVRIYSRELTIAEAGQLSRLPRLQWLVRKPASKNTTNETEEAFGLWLNSFDAQYPVFAKLQERLKREQTDIRKRGTVAHVMQEKDETAEAFLLFRGQYDQRRDKLTPSTPQILPPMAADLPRNRLGFAKWLVTPEQPLTARVTVNRFWQELFGTGLVRTSGDFGIAGETPSHPELLDWLAVEFRENGWDVKKFYKLLVTSATYQQSAVNTPEKLERDPKSRLLARGPRFRMDAEMIRDTALAASGLLVPKLGGPSVKPYQPDGVWEAVAMPNSDTKAYKRDQGEALYRRSLYTFWKRAAPPASMEILNAPNRETCTVQRERSDTPIQALVTMNDPQFVEAARNLAAHALRQPDTNSVARIDFMAERLIARSLRPAEKKIVSKGLKDLLAHYQAAPNDAAALVSVGESKADATLDKPTLAAYTMVANQLMNLDEVLNK